MSAKSSVLLCINYFGGVCPFVLFAQTRTTNLARPKVTNVCAGAGRCSHVFVSYIIIFVSQLTLSSHTVVLQKQSTQTPSKFVPRNPNGVNLHPWGYRLHEPRRVNFPIPDTTNETNAMMPLSNSRRQTNRVQPRVARNCSSLRYYISSQTAHPCPNTQRKINGSSSDSGGDGGGSGGNIQWKKHSKRTGRPFAVPACHLPAQQEGKSRRHFYPATFPLLPRAYAQLADFDFKKVHTHNTHLHRQPITHTFLSSLSKPRKPRGAATSPASIYLSASRDNQSISRATI